MPWKGEKDPYKIWISEIILQQTRVQQGLNYYNRFINQYPSVHDLANANENEVFKLWEGLGYYSRCKNIIASAKFITNDLYGQFPNSYNEIVKLKGIGPYTASAIASFAYNLPHAVVDGNVFRVLSRIFGIFTPTDSTVGKKMFTILAEKLLAIKRPAEYNQALMDFGAIICKPRSPLCFECPMNKICFAFNNQSIDLLPVKEKKIIRKKRWFYYLVIVCQSKIYVRKRLSGDIWENLYEFVLVENHREMSPSKFTSGKMISNILNREEYIVKNISKVYNQLLTHQQINGRFISIEVNSPTPIKGYSLVTESALKTLPFPKFITSYLQD